MPDVTLREGSRGQDVKRLQLLLNTRTPTSRLSLDGTFGDGTKQAVIRFQRAHGLTADGVVGPSTWAVLGQRGAVASPPQPLCAPRWMDVAALEEGVHEDSRPGHHTQRIIQYHRETSLSASTDEVPWCSSFVNWVMKQVGYRGTNSALARSWLSWGTGQTAPQPGAITVIKRKGATSDAATGSSTGYHVAFFVSLTSTHVRLLGGNQRDSVRYTNFSLASYSIEGHRWPA